MLQFILTGVMLGIVLAIITSLFWNIAPIIQKEALETMDEIDAGQVLVCSPGIMLPKEFTISVSGVAVLTLEDRPDLVVAPPGQLLDARLSDGSPSVRRSGVF